MTRADNRKLMQVELSQQLAPFGLKAGAFLEAPDDSWVCQLYDDAKGEFMGKVRGDKASTIQKCLDNGFELMADFTTDRAADVMIVAYPSRV